MSSFLTEYFVSSHCLNDAPSSAMLLYQFTSFLVLLVLLDIMKSKCKPAYRALLLEALAFYAEPFDKTLLVNYMSADGDLLDALFLMKVFTADFAVFRLVRIDPIPVMVGFDLFAKLLEPIYRMAQFVVVATSEELPLLMSLMSVRLQVCVYFKLKYFLINVFHTQ